MKLKKTLTALAVASALTVSSGAMAYTLNIGDAQGTTFDNLSFNNFAGFDWASNGTAVVDGFDSTAATDVFDLTYWSTAVAILDAGGVSITNATLGLSGFPLLSIPAGYEYTIVAKLNETSSCLTFSGPICTDATFQVNSGTFFIYYDVNPDADQVTGAGITDGVLVASGTILSQPGGGFNVISGGNAVLQGLVTYTDLTYITPSLSGTTAVSTLQVGGNVTGWVAPDSMPGTGGATAVLPEGSFALQADANQDFHRIPEPGSLALLGLGLFGLGAARRKLSA